MKIFGTSGASVFLTAQLLRRYKPTVYLKDTELRNNHTGVLRFNSDKIFKSLNIPYTEVKISKSIFYNGELRDSSNLQLSNMYSQKVTGKIIPRSINNLEPSTRYIAPDNFMEILTYGIDIEYGVDINKELFKPYDGPKLSYCKMNELMKELEWENIPKFSFSPVYTLNVRLIVPECNVYQTIYYPGLEKYYRASITKDNLIVEYISEPTESEQQIDVSTILNHFGISDYTLDAIKFNILPVGKMSPIPEDTRQNFIYHLTDKYGIYSFGRNGIWKSIRLDQLYDDVLKIDKLIQSGLYHRNRELMNIN